MELNINCMLNMSNGLEQDKAKLMPKECDLTAEQKYWVFSKRYRNNIKPAHWVPHWTKMPFDRKWAPSTLHEIEGSRKEAFSADMIKK
jgi:hypothetical protein